MKARRLLLCILLSLALTVTFIPVMSFAEDISGLTIDECGTIVITGWQQGDGGHTEWTGPDGATAQLCGTFRNYDVDTYPHSKIGDLDGVIITPPKGKHVEAVTHNGKALEYSAQDDRYLFTVSADTVNGDQRTPGNVIAVSFADGEVTYETDDIDDYGTIVIDGWQQGDGGHTEWTGPNGATAQLCGTFSNFDEDNYPHSLIDSRVDIIVTPPDGKHVEKVTLNGETLVIDDDGRYKFDVYADTVNGSQRTPGNVITITFAEDPYSDDINDYGSIAISGWRQNQGDHLTWTGPNGSTAQLYGSFTEFDEDNYPHALIGDKIAVEIFPPEGKHVGTLTLNGMPLEWNPRTESYPFVVAADIINGSQRTPGNVIAVTFEDGEIIKDIDDYGTIEIDGWEHDYAGYLWTSPDGATGEFSEVNLVRFDEDELPHAPIGADVYLDIDPPEEQVVDELTLNGEALMPQEDSGTFVFKANADTVNGDQRKSGNVIDVTFEDEYGFEDLTNVWMGSAGEIVLDEEQTVNTEDGDALFAFTPQNDGVYVFYSKDNTRAKSAKRVITAKDNSESSGAIDPIGRVSGNDGKRISTGDDFDSAHFKIYFDAKGGETYYLQAKNTSGAAAFKVGVTGSDIEGISFRSGGQQLIAEKSCTSGRDYQINKVFQVGDKLTVTYAGDLVKEYICSKRADGNLAFVDADNNVLPGEPDLDLEQEFDPDNAAGSTRNISAKAVYAALESNEVTVKVKYAYQHGTITHHVATTPKCNATGNIEYWQCSKCRNYYSDADGTKAISAGSLMIPKGGHKWTSITTDQAGYLHNGSTCERCEYCGSTRNAAVVPGWAGSYVKGMKAAKGKGAITVKWKKQKKNNLKKFNGYQIEVATDPGFTNIVKSTTAGKKSKSKKIKGLKKKTQYYVHMRSYTVSGGVIYYSPWTIKGVKTK